MLEPGAIEAAVAAARAAAAGRDEHLRAVELELEQARYHAERSFRQYDVSDPENRLVTGELKRRWNKTLARISALDERLRELKQAPSSQVAIDAAELLTLGADFARVWQDPSTDMRLKKRIIRALVEEVVASESRADVEQLPAREASLRDETVERLALDELHGQEVDAFRLFDRVDGHDAGAVEGGERFLPHAGIARAAPGSRPSRRAAP